MAHAPIPVGAVSDREWFAPPFGEGIPLLQALPRPRPHSGKGFPSYIRGRRPLLRGVLHIPRLHIGGLLLYPDAMAHQHRLRHGRVSEPGRVYAVTKCTANRQPLLCAPHPAPSDVADIIFDALRFACGRRWIAVAACVVMPDHLHLLLQLGREKGLPVLLGDLFRFTAREVNRARDCTGAVWQAGYFEHAVRRDEDMEAQARYVVENPVRAGWVDDWRQWPHGALYPDWGGWPLPVDDL